MRARKLGRLLSALVFCCSCYQTYAADLHPGKQKAEDERCAECHGVDGNIHAPNESAKIPKLAGQSPDYLLKQFQDFRSGERHNDFMAMMARNLADDDVIDILAWYGSQPVMRGEGTETPAAKSLGRTLYLEGDASRGILACAGCHGEDGKGARQSIPSNLPIEPKLIPVIGGQDWHYLEQQLRDWRSGERANSADALMNKVTEKLNDAEITALTDFISALN